MQAVLVRIVIAAIKHHDKKKLVEENISFGFQLSGKPIVEELLTNRETKP